MRCRIDNCNHVMKKGISQTKHVGLSWYEFGICSCCANEFVIMGVLSGFYGHSNSCSAKIKSELIKIKEQCKKQILK